MSLSPDPTSDDPFAVALDAEGLKRRSLSGSLVTGASQAAKVLLQIASQVILARLLFPRDFGLLAMVYPVIGFIQVFNDLGFAQAIIQRPVLTQERVSALFWVNVAVSMVLALLVALAAPVAALVYAEPRVTLLMVVLGAIMPIVALGVHPAALLARRMRFGTLAINEVVALVVGMAFTIAAAWTGWSYWSLVAGQLANTVAGVALGWATCGWRPSRPAFAREAWADLKFGGGVTGANLATFFTTSGDNIVIGLTTSSAALGLYDRSYRLVVQPLGLLVAPISRVAVPLLSRLADRPVEYRAAYLGFFRALLLLCLPPMLVCITNGDIVIDLFLGARWNAAAPIFSWICVGGLTSGIYLSGPWLFISQGRTVVMMRFLIVAAVINLASYLIGSIWGLSGVAAVAALVFVLVTTPLVLFGATRHGPVQFRDLIRCGAPIVAQGAIVATLLVGQRELGFTGLVQLVSATTLAVVMFVALALAVPSQRQIVVRLLDEVARRWRTTFAEARREPAP